MSYILTPQAENDLEDIARHTLSNWGTDQFYRYRDSLKHTFENIGNGAVVGREFSSKYSGLKVTRCQQHYVFYLDEGTPTIIGIIHERMDVVSRLTERLESGD